MYLKNIAIKNIGPIDELSVELPFKGNGNPKPIIFVGENGTGKTIFLSQIIDSFYEIASELFNDVGIKNGDSRSYYKVSGGLNLKIGKDKGFSILGFIDSDNNKIEYFDKVGDVKKDDFTRYIVDFKLSPNSAKKNQKETTSIDDTRKEKLQNEWITSVHFYQPAYRYEEPFWKNDSFVNYTRFEDKKRFSGRLDKELEIISSTKENKSYLMDLVLDFTNNQKNIIDRLTWKSINDVLKAIKKNDNVRFGIGPRGGYRVSIVATDKNGTEYNLLSSIDNLSLGESILLNLFINIIRHGDKPPRFTTEITGIVAIDEIDVHLHSDLQNTILPQLIKLFPKVQFIITTHSPLFLLGMQKEFGENGFEIRNMPNGELITTERFSEFENAYNVLKETEKFEYEVSSKIKESTKPIVFVEGDYDTRYINKAAMHFNQFDLLSKIQILDGDGYGNLDKIWNNYNSKLSKAIPQKVILLYDCDTNKQDTEKGMIFKKIIPPILENVIKKGIENLFEKSIIEKAIQNKKAYIDITPPITKTIRGEDISELEKWDINKDEKGNLCDWICANGTKEDFKNFEIIFKIIQDCLEDN